MSALISFLARHPGEMTTKQFLEEDGWNGDEHMATTHSTRIRFEQPVTGFQFTVVSCDHLSRRGLW